MSKRSHHRHSNINVNELADALTRFGWQPPQNNRTVPPFRGGNANLPIANYGGGNQLNNLAALGSMLGGGNPGDNLSFPPPQNGNGGETMMPMQMPMQMPMLPQAPSRQTRSASPANDRELLKKLLREILAILKEK